MRKIIRTLVYIFVVSIGIFGSPATWAQSNSQDSTQKQEIIRIIVEGVDLMNNHKYTDAINLFEHADSISLAIGNLKFHASCQYNLGVSYYRSGDYVKYGEYFDKALNICQITNDTSSLAHFTLALGKIHTTKGDFQKAIEYIINAIYYYENVGNDNLLANAYNSLAIVHEKIGKDEIALEYYNKSIQFYNNQFDTLNIARILNNIGLFYSHRHIYDSAIYYFEKAIEYKIKTSDSLEAINTFNNLGEVYFAKKDYAKAKKLYFKAMHLANLSPSKNDHIDIANALAEIFLEEGNLADAIKLLNDSRELALQNNDNEILLRNFNLSMQTYEKMGNHRKSLKYAKLYIDLNKKIYNKYKTQIINDLQFQYETEKKDLQIANLNEINNLKTKSLELRNKGLIIISILLLLSIVLVIKVYLDFRQKKKAHEQIRFLMHEKQHRTKNNLQLLSSVLTMQSSNSSNAKKDASMTGEHRVQSIVLLDKLLYENDLESDEIEISIYINEILSGLLDAYDTNGCIKIIKEIHVLKIAAEQAKYIGLLINEIVTNSFKYAFPYITNPVLNISFKMYKKNNYELIVKDNGPGLSIDNQKKTSNSLGMKLIDTMSRQLKGNYQIENRNGFYFKLKFELKSKG